MRCPVCDIWNGESNTYCVECGAAMIADEAFQTPVEELSRAELQDLVYRLQAEVGRIQEHLSRNRGVLGYYRRNRPTRRASVRPPSESTPQTPSAPLSEPTPQASPIPSVAASESTPQASPSPGVAASEPMPGTPLSAEPSFSDSSERSQDHELYQRFNVDWEMVLGGNWLARIGILAVIIGVGFFLKLAFDNNWIGDTGRVALGVASGLALLVGGEYISKRYPIYSQSLSGGGVAILYLTIFAAFTFYGLIGVYPAIGLLFLVSLTSAALALRHNSMALAVIAILGAFSAPFVIGASGGATGEPDGGGSANAYLMFYVIVVDLGVLALSTFRNWRWLTLLALVGSSLSFVIWFDAGTAAGQPPGLIVSQIVLTVVFLIFAGATTLFHVIWRRAPRPFDYTLMVLNATTYLPLSYLVMWEDLRDWMGAFTLALALFYALLAYVFYTKVREQPNLARMAVGASAVILAIAAPVQLDELWIGVSWAAQGAVLIWLSFRMESWQQRLLGAGMLALAFVWMVALGGVYILLSVFEVVALDDSPTTLPWRYALSFIMYAAAFYAAAYIDRRKMRDIDIWKVRLFSALVIGGSVAPTMMVAAHLPGSWVAAGWAVEALALTWVSFRLGVRELRLFGALALALAFVWMAVDSLYLYPPDSASIPIHYALSSIMVVVGFYLAAYLYSLKAPDVETWEAYLPPVLRIGGSALIALIVWALLPGSWVAIGWAVEALALTWVSLRLNLREMGWFGWGVFALLSLWLLIIVPPNNYVLFLNLRMLAFVSAIAALYAAALLWWRESSKDSWDIYVPYSLAAAANILTLWILSFEVIETVDRLVADAGDAAFYAKSLALSLVWALYASVGLALGILLRWRIVRLASLCLLAVPIVKLFLFDSFALDQGYRVAAFLCLGVILLAGGFMYQRYGEVIRGFLFEGQSPASKTGAD